MTLRLVCRPMPGLVLGLRDDSQIDFSTHNVRWTLAPDPPGITSKDKNRFFKKLAQNLGPDNPRKTECFRALRITKTTCTTSCLLRINPIQTRLFYRLKVQEDFYGTPLMISGTIKASPVKL